MHKHCPTCKSSPDGRIQRVGGEEDIHEITYIPEREDGNVLMGDCVTKRQPIQIRPKSLDMMTYTANMYGVIRYWPGFE